MSEFGGRAKKSKLGALFAQDQQWKESGNTSLKYSSQPPPAAAASAKSSAAAADDAPTKVIHAAAINLIQYDASRQGTSLGTRGLAIIHTLATRLYTLVCYEPQSQKQECSASVNENFSLTVLAGGGKFAAFYDDNQQYWAVKLNSDEQVEQLCQAVTMVKHAHIQLWKFNSEFATSLQWCDIVPSPSDQKGVGKGDYAKVKYTMHLCSAEHPKGLGTLVGSVDTRTDKSKPIKVGGGKELVGIEQGLLGMSKGGTRFLVVPPNLGYGAAEAGAIPPNSTLLVTLSVTNVKYKEEGGKKKEKQADPEQQQQQVAQEEETAAAAPPPPAAAA